MGYEDGLEAGKVETKPSQIWASAQVEGYLGGMHVVKVCKDIIIIYKHQMAFNGYHIISVSSSHISKYIPTCTSPSFVSPLVCSYIFYLLSLLLHLRRKCYLTLPHDRTCVSLCGLTTLSS